MSTRREFLNSWGPIAGFVAMAAGPPVVYASLGAPARDEYEPLGYMDGDTPGSTDVDFVTVDGERVEHVTKLNDVEGWVDYYGPNPYVDGQPLRTFRRTGAVRVHWRRR